MAASPTINKQALRKLEDQLTCGICLDFYTEPKLLQCFHVFCKQCLERLVVRDPHELSLHCPTGHRSTLLPPTVVAVLQTAFYLKLSCCVTHHFTNNMVLGYLNCATTMRTFIYAFQMSPCAEVIAVIFPLDLHSISTNICTACHMGMNISTASHLGMSHHVSTTSC